MPLLSQTCSICKSDVLILVQIDDKWICKNCVKPLRDLRN